MLGRYYGRKCSVYTYKLDLRAQGRNVKHFELKAVELHNNNSGDLNIFRCENNVKNYSIIIHLVREYAH